MIFAPEILSSFTETIDEVAVQAILHLIPLHVLATFLEVVRSTATHAAVIDAQREAFIDHV